MPESISIEIEFLDAQGFTTIETLRVLRLEGNRYQVEESALFAEFRWRDIVELKRLEENSYSFVRVIEPSGYRVDTFILNSKVLESEDMKLLLNHVVELGGNWEIVSSGVLFTHLPDHSDLDVKLAIDVIRRRINAHHE